jgi:hypothetical protein
VLPPFIIEQIRKREEDARQNHQPHLELPIPVAPPAQRRTVPDPDDQDRGVIIIDLMGD